jgi:vancomycin resistance protein VanW
MKFPRRLREALPLALRRTLRLGQRFAVDLYQGAQLTAPPPANVSFWSDAAYVRQAMGTTPNAAAKQHNIALAASVFSGRPVAPGAVFSFWGWLGAPTPARGFQMGRALRQDKLVLESGGGLCQLAGALYAAGLQAGLAPVERHAHSVDLYTDDTRYAPLGSDATVSFGFKDLRLRNPHAAPLAFLVAASDTDLVVRVVAERPIQPCRVEFKTVKSGAGFAETETWVDGRLAARDRYRRD